MQALVRFLLIFASTKLIVSKPQHLQQQSQYHLDPANEPEFEYPPKDPAKRTIGSGRHYALGKHIGIHPLGFKYVLGYTPINIKYVPVVKHQTVLKPVLHQNIKQLWQPVLPPVRQYLPSALHVHKPIHHTDHGWKPIAAPVHEHRPWAEEVQHIHSVVEQPHLLPAAPVVQPVKSIVPALPAPHLHNYYYFQTPVAKPALLPQVPLFQVARPQLPVLPLGAAFPAPVLQSGPAVAPSRPAGYPFAIPFHPPPPAILHAQHPVAVHPQPVFPGIHPHPVHHPVVVHPQPAFVHHPQSAPALHPYPGFQQHGPEQHPFLVHHQPPSPLIPQPAFPPHVHPQPAFPPHIHLQPEFPHHVHPQPALPPHIHPQPEFPHHVHPQPALPPHIHPQPAFPPHVHPEPALPPHIHPQPAFPPHVHPEPTRPPHVHVQQQPAGLPPISVEFHGNRHLVPFNNRFPFTSIQGARNPEQTPPVVVGRQPHALPLPPEVHTQLIPEVQHSPEQPQFHFQPQPQAPFNPEAAIQPGQTDLQVPLHLPDHPHFRIHRVNQFQPTGSLEPPFPPFQNPGSILRPSISLEPPLTHGHK